MPYSHGVAIPTGQRWWRSESEELHAVLNSVQHRLRERQVPRRNLYQIMAEMYGGSELAGLGLGTYDPSAQMYYPSFQPWNIMRSGVDTVVSKVAKNRPKPTFITDRGDYKMMKRAKKLERFVDGLFYQLDIYNKTIPIFRDACVFGTGILSLYRRGDQIHAERIMPWEAFVDIADARYGAPQCFYIIRWIDKDVLTEQFPDFEEEIQQADITVDDIDHLTDYEVQANRVLVTEAWHLPSGPDAEDGRHAVIIQNATLVDEQYDKHYFPFAFIRYKQPVAGFWGNGLGEELQGFQMELNEVGDRVQQAHYIVGGGIWLVPDGADIVDTELNNGIGVIIHHKPGMPPQYINPEPVNEATYQYLKDLPLYALQFSGISQMSAQSVQPKGITAAKALQTLDDVETERFNLIGRSWENLHMDIAKQCIDLCKEIAEEDPGFGVRAPYKKYALDIKWSEVDMERDAYVMQVFPTNLLAKTPAARLQQVQDLFQAGIIDRAMFLRLLDAPDINAEEDLEAAARTVADEQIEHMLDSEDPWDDPDAVVHVEPYQDLIYALHRAQAHYNLGRIQGMSEGTLNLLRNYMQEAKDLLEMQFAKAPPPNLPGGMPGAPPDVAGPAAMVGMPQAPPPGIPMGPPAMPPAGMPPQGAPPMPPAPPPAA